MALPRVARLETVVLSAALVALIACGSAGDGTTTPATCAACEGAICGTRCTDLSTALADQVESALPASACVPETAISGGATVCSAQTCPAGGAAGCTVALSWSPVALGRDTHLLEGTVTATSNVDAHLGTSCTATVTAMLSYRAAAAFACAPGSESATFGAATTKVESSSVTPGAGCELLVTYLDLFRPTFAASAESALKNALAGATASVTATCP
jgi:hypothetical protein